MDRVLLFSFKSDNVKVNIEVFFDEKNNLVIEGYDIGKAVEEFWGDSDYEYSTTIKEHGLKKLYDVTAIPEGSKEALLLFIQHNYSGNRCYSEFRDFLSKNTIDFESFSWN